MGILDQIVNPEKRNLFKQVGYKPIPQAVEIHNSNAQVILVTAPSRSSKSTSFLMEALNIFMRKKTNIWVVGQKYDNTDRFIFGKGSVKGLLDICNEKLPFLVNNRLGVHKKDHSMESRIGSSIKGKSVTYPSGFVAEPVDLIILEDAASYPADFYDKHIRPRVLDSGGRILINTVPPLKTSNWVVSLAKIDSVFYKHWGLYDNIYLSKQEIEKYVNECPTHLRAAFIDGLLPKDDSSIFGDFSSNVLKVSQIAYQKDHLYQAGFDIGMINDRSVLSISDLTDWQLVYMDIFPPRYFKKELVEQRLMNGLKQYNFPNTYIDISGIGEKFSEMVESHNFLLPVRMYNSQIRNSVINGLALAINRGFGLLNNKTLLEELGDLDVTLGTRGYIYKPKYHDDTIISVGLSIYGWSERAGKPEAHKAQEMLVAEKEIQDFYGEPENIDSLLGSPGEYLLGGE